MRASTVALLIICACGAPTEPDSQGDSADTAAPDLAWPDPFVAAPDRSPLTDIDADLAVVLESGGLEDACERYAQNPSDELELLCGKAMFFYESFDTAGVPLPLVEFLVDVFPGQIGKGFSKLGMIPDTTKGGRFPIGMAPGAPMGDVKTLAFTCASCHFAQLPDGRYAVGAPNHDYQYGVQNLAIAVLPMAMSGGAVAPEAQAVIQPLVDRLESSTALRIAFMVNLLPLLGTQAPDFPPAAQREYAR